MKRIAIALEGQTELIFLRNLITKIFDQSKISFDCFNYRSGNFNSSSYSYKNDNALIHFVLINIGNDKKVESFIKEQGDVLCEKGYEKVIGLRDMYSEEYRKLSNKIDSKIIEKFIKGSNSIINALKHSSKINVYFAIMEIEAWFISMYSLIKKINQLLTVEYIESSLNKNIKEIDAEKEFFKPSNFLDEIYQQIGMEYDKSFDIVESLTSSIDLEDIKKGIEHGRCKSFELFFNELKCLNIFY